MNNSCHYAKIIFCGNYLALYYLMTKNMGKNRSQNWDIIIIGAGASGMVAAITAARRGKRVAVIERMDKPGKKLLATGNGRCNYTNAVMNDECYHGNQELIASVLKRFGFQDTLSFFHEIGIYPREKNGYYYPNSMQALSVTEALIQEMKNCNIGLFTGCTLLDIKPGKYGFTIQTSLGNFSAAHIIAATGLKASPKLGSDGSAFPILKELGHRFSPILPALCGFEAEGMPFKKVSGVRCDAELTLWIDGKIHKRERGELQLADYGISGIPVFQISSPAVHALYDKKQTEVHINFLPGLSEEEVEKELKFRLERFSEEEALCGLLHQKLIPVCLSKAQPDLQIRMLSDSIRDFPVTLTKARGFEYAQVCTGGIRTEEINTETLESRLCPGLYFAGELLDVDGICGGYNLQWAWASGYVAGTAAG